MRNMKISILALIAHFCRCRKNLWKEICDGLEMGVVVVEWEYVGGGGGVEIGKVILKGLPCELF